MLKKRHNPLKDCELKFADDETKEGEFEGYASTFDNKDSYGDIIVKGAFEGSLGKNILMLHSHNPMMPIGKWLEMREDARGLWVRGEFTPGHTEAQNAYASAKHGAISGLSIGFRTPKGGADYDDETQTRTLNKIDLVEISLVAMPANDLAMVTSVKSEIIDSIKSLRDAETILRDAGFSKSAALHFVSRVKHLCRSESATDVKDEIAKLLSPTDILDIIRKV